MKPSRHIRFARLAILPVILLRLPPAHSVLQTSLLRFIAFDGVGLALLVLAVLSVRKLLQILYN